MGAKTERTRNFNSVTLERVNNIKSEMQLKNQLYADEKAKVMQDKYQRAVTAERNKRTGLTL